MLFTSGESSATLGASRLATRKNAPPLDRGTIGLTAPVLSVSNIGTRAGILQRHEQILPSPSAGLTPAVAPADDR